MRYKLTLPAGRALFSRPTMTPPRRAEAEVAAKRPAHHPTINISGLIKYRHSHRLIRYIRKNAIYSHRRPCGSARRMDGKNWH